MSEKKKTYRCTGCGHGWTYEYIRKPIPGYWPRVGGWVLELDGKPQRLTCPSCLRETFFMDKHTKLFKALMEDIAKFGTPKYLHR